MNIKILLFGVSKDIVGDSKLNIEVPDGQNVGEMMQDLKNKYPTLNDLTSLLVAVNSEYADSDVILMESDEIALIPPVSGG